VVVVEVVVELIVFIIREGINHYNHCSPNQLMHVLMSIRLMSIRAAVDLLAMIHSLV